MELVEEKAHFVLANYVYQMTENQAYIQLLIRPDDFALADPSVDDAYKVAVYQGKGVIKASNPRSLLLGVYHFLRACGCSFVRPGKINERIPIPQCQIEDLSATLDVEAGHRYRGICIEGSCNLEDTLDLLEWLPKVGMNSYFMQFREGYQFFERWYQAEANQYREAWPFDLTIDRSLLPKIIHCAKENGLSYQGVGHGFTCECFGVPGLGWMEIDAWPKEYEAALAMRSGVRDMAWKTPLISALCYSNQQVQEKVVTSAVDYIAQHPELDVVHFWLDDGNNNKCECENCRHTRVADFYVEILNRLDEALSRRGLSTKIVFLAYHETLWPPQKNLLKNPDRFIFMFAPIQRSFNERFPKISEAGATKAYCLNAQPFPANNLEAASFLKDWQEYLKKIDFDKRDSFDFDYYLNNFGDAGQFAQAKLIYEDIQVLQENGLNGIINCQMQRLFGHSSLPMFVMAMTLLEPKRPFDEIVSEFFKGAFADSWEEMSHYWQKLTDASAFMCEDRLAKASEIENFREVLDEKPSILCKDLTTASFLQSFSMQVKIYRELNELEDQRRLQQKEKLEIAAQKLFDFTAAYENEYSLDYDVRYIHQYVERRFGLDAKKEWL